MLKSEYGLLIPLLFLKPGTVRSNLDAFENHTDLELYDALERVQLIPSNDTIRQSETVNINGESRPSLAISNLDNTANPNIFTSLTSRISEGGLNLSQGQRQLLCLARAIVSRPKIMVLDEATSAVDMATDARIQRSIREQFGGSTLLVIAHRLSTIVDFDRILVMSDGQGVEFDSPKNLLARRGVFWDMVMQSGEKEVLQDIILNGRKAPTGIE